MIKRALSLLLTLVMVIGMIPVSAQAAELYHEFYYEVHEDQVEIVGYVGDATEVVIPAEYKNLPVTAIGTSAFANRSDLTSVSIPSSITFIGNGAFFGCTGLTAISLPENLTAIDGMAFADCTGLTSISIPDGLTSIGNFAFDGCSGLTGINIPDSVRSIGEGAFYDCSSLIRIIIPDGITAVLENTFSYCSNLTQVSLPNSITSIGLSAFYGCTNLTSINIPDSLTFIDAYAFTACKSLTSMDLPYGVTDIGMIAFADCSGLTEINIPNSVTSIGFAAFQRCTSLTSIDIPESVTYIGDFAFVGCSNLSTINFKGDAPDSSHDYNGPIFNGLTATAYYPSGNPTWTEDVMQNYGGDITWVPYNPNNPFLDVPAGAFYEAPVLWALENGITTGATADSFNPNGTCLRAHVVTFLHRAAGNPEPNSTKNPFADVKSSDFFYKPVLWAVENGITNGVSATEFGSYSNCNRAAVVTFLWRAKGQPEPTSTDNPFVDVKASDFFYKAVLWAVENGITNGVDATHFGPATECNRAQVVTFLYRAYD